ncbi:hypothetical protein [Umezawaea sp.]|uniref:hypothetical protein n=1 Tax=Umezawaea sp. TaxID=1955258 RepID=UPI002ED1BD90
MLGTAEPGVGTAEPGVVTPADADGGTVGFGIDAPPGTDDAGAPEPPTGALEIVPSPTGALGRSNAPFAAPGAVNLLLRSVD